MMLHQVLNVFIIWKRERLFGSWTGKEMTNLERCAFSIIFGPQVCNLEEGSRRRVIFFLVWVSDPNRSLYNCLLKHRMMSMSWGELLTLSWRGRVLLVFFHEIPGINLLRVFIGHFELRSLWIIRHRCLMVCESLHLKRNLIFVAIDGIIEPVSRIAFDLLGNRLKHALIAYQSS